MNIVLMLNTARQVERSVFVSTPTDRASIGLSRATVLICPVHHQSVVCHGSFDISTFSRSIVKALATQRGVGRQQLTVSESPSVGEYLMSVVEPDNVQVVSVLVRTGMKRCAERQIASVFESVLVRGLR